MFFNFFLNNNKKNIVPRQNLIKIYIDEEKDSDKIFAATKVLPQINVVANNALSARVCIVIVNPISLQEIPE